MSGWRRFVLRTAIFDLIVIGIALRYAAAVGSFDRLTVGFVMMVVSLALLVIGAVTLGALPFTGSGPPGISYVHALNTKLLLQQEVAADGKTRALIRRPRGPGAVMLAAGASLLLLSMFVVG